MRDGSFSQPRQQWTARTVVPNVANGRESTLRERRVIALRLESARDTGADVCGCASGVADVTHGLGEWRNNVLQGFGGMASLQWPSAPQEQVHIAALDRDLGFIMIAPSCRVPAILTDDPTYVPGSVVRGTAAPAALLGTHGSRCSAQGGGCYRCAPRKKRSQASRAAGRRCRRPNAPGCAQSRHGGTCYGATCGRQASRAAQDPRAGRAKGRDSGTCYNVTRGQSAAAPPSAPRGAAPRCRG